MKKTKLGKVSLNDLDAIAQESPGPLFVTMAYSADLRRELVNDLILASFHKELNHKFIDTWRVSFIKPLENLIEMYDGLVEFDKQSWDWMKYFVEK